MEMERWGKEWKLMERGRGGEVAFCISEVDCYKFTCENVQHLLIAAVVVMG